MDADVAQQIEQQWAEAAKLPGQDSDELVPLRESLRALLVDVLPDPEHWTLFTGTDGGTQIVALAGAAVYRVQYVAPEDGAEVFFASRHPLEGAPMPTVSCRVTYEGGRELRYRSWKLFLPGCELEFITIEHELEGGGLSRAERLARAVVEAQGWPLPLRAT